MEDIFQVDQNDHQAMLDQLQAAYPLEACGLMAGQSGKVERLFPVTNSLASPFAYEMEPAELLAALLEIDQQGWDLLAIYHSHPNGPERPSPTDIAKAYYPEAYQVIVSLHDRRQPVIRAFSIVEGRVSEVSYQVA